MTSVPPLVNRVPKFSPMTQNARLSTIANTSTPFLAGAGRYTPTATAASSTPRREADDEPLVIDQARSVKIQRGQPRRFPAGQSVDQVVKSPGSDRFAPSTAKYEREAQRMNHNTLATRAPTALAAVNDGRSSLTITGPEEDGQERVNDHCTRGTVHRVRGASKYATETLTYPPDA